MRIGKYRTFKVLIILSYDSQYITRRRRRMASPLHGLDVRCLMNTSGIYIVQLLNEEPVPVTRDPRYVNICAKVNSSNIKVGKAKDLATRKLDYFKDFDEKNVDFEPLAKLDDIVTAERAILRALKQYRKLSPKGGKLEWLEGISYEDAKRIVFETLNNQQIQYTLADNYA
jgi:hypothetical protein